MSLVSAQPEKEREAPSRSVLPNAYHLALSQIVRRVFRMAVLFWVARLLGVSGFGEYALLLTVVEMVAVLSGSGYWTYLCRETAKHPEVAWGLGRKVTQVRWLLILPVLGSAALVLRLIRFSPTVISDTVLLSLSLFPRAVSEAAQGVLAGLSRFSPLVRIEGLQGCILLAAAPVLIMKGFGLTGVLLAEIAATTGGGLYALAVVLRYLDRRNPQRFGFVTILRSLYAFNIFPFITNLYDRADVILLARLAGTFATGIYSLPYRVLSSFQIVPYGITGALLPRLSADGASGHVARPDFNRALQLLYTWSLFLVLVTFVFAPTVVHWLLGPSYAASALAMKILIWAAVPMFVNYAMNILLIAAHREKVFLWTTTICTVFNLVANLILIPRYSFVAAAGITVFTELLLFCQNVYLVRQLPGGISLPRRWASATAAFVLAFACALIFSHFTSVLIGGTLVCAAFAVLAAWTTREALFLVERPRFQ